MPSPSGRPNTLPYHKPNCQCPPCKRAQKADAGRAGAEAAAEARVPELSSQQPEVLVKDNIPVLVDDKSLQARVLQIAALKAKGLNNKQIGQKLGLTAKSVSTLMWKANKQKLIEYDDPFERFEHQLVPKIVDNIEHWLDQKDKKMTIEAAKGAGLFKSHQALKVEGERPQTILALKIELPPGTQMGGGGTLTSQESEKMAVGMVVGKPRRMLEGKIVEDEQK